MSDLKHAVSLLKKTIRRSLAIQGEFSGSMARIQAVEKRLSAKADKQLALPEMDEALLLQKLASGETLSYREKRAIPLILFSDRCDMPAFQSGLKAMDFGSDGQVRRLFYAYLSQYDDRPLKDIHHVKQEVIRSVLQKYFKRPCPERTNRLLKMGFQYGQLLFFDKAATTNMSAMLLKCQGVHTCYEQLNLPRGLYGCAYMRASLRMLFLSPRIPVPSKFHFLEEMMAGEGGEASHHEENVYADVYPAAATGLITGVARMQASQRPSFQKKCIDMCYDLLGDPRFGRKTIKWDSVSLEARTIFLHWLAENDLNLFFSIIEKTAVDDMWSYRKAFWQGYLPYITNTWVLFGKFAAFLAQEASEYHKNGYGLIDKAPDPQQSAFAFQIGQYVFVEWSHNGALRVWKAEEAPKVFGEKEISRQDILYSSYEKMWRHAGKENYRWQKHVGDWIYEHCGIQ